MLSMIARATRWAPWLLIAALGLYCWTLRGDVQSFALSAAHAAEQQANALAAAQSKTRQAEAELYAAASKIDDAYQRGQRDAQGKTDRIVADLRSGTLSLRRELATASVSATAATAAVGDARAATGLSVEDAEFLVRESGRADDIVRQLTAAQSVIRSYQDPLP